VETHKEVYKKENITPPVVPREKLNDV